MAIEDLPKKKYKLTVKAEMTEQIVIQATSPQEAFDLAKSGYGRHAGFSPPTVVGFDWEEMEELEAQKGTIITAPSKIIVPKVSLT
jgi:hypothetical protein